MESVSKSEGMQKVLGAFNKMEKQTVDLPANTCVALCVEENAKVMRGKYVDSQYDLGEVLEEAKKGEGERIERERLYWLKLEEI